MADNDDALAATALALNEDAKATRRRKTKTPQAETIPPLNPEDKRQRFTLDDSQATALRLSIAADNGEGDPVADFWAATGKEMQFDPETLVLIDMAEEGPVVFSAISTAEDAPAGEIIEPSGDEDEHEQPDPEEQLNAGLQQMEDAAFDMALQSSTLVGDLTAGLWEIVSRLQKPVSAHSQFEKRDLHAKLEHIAKITARQAVDVVAADDRITVKAVLEKIAIGDKTMITLKLGAMPEDEMADAIQSLFHAQKKSVLIVTADADRHMGKRREIVPPDEEELPFDAGRDTPKPQAAHPADDSDLNDGEHAESVVDIAKRAAEDGGGESADEEEQEPEENEE